MVETAYGATTSTSLHVTNLNDGEFSSPQFDSSKRGRWVSWMAGSLERLLQENGSRVYAQCSSHVVTMYTRLILKVFLVRMLSCRGRRLRTLASAFVFSRLSVKRPLARRYNAMQSTDKPFYVTTPIFYPNAREHENHPPSYSLT